MLSYIVRRVWIQAGWMGAALSVLALCFAAHAHAVERTWVGPQYWANRLQDWQRNDEWIECIQNRPAEPMRTVHLLTHQLSERNASFEAQVAMQPMRENNTPTGSTWAGILLGAGGNDLDYRAAALVHHLPGRGGGLLVAVNGEGEIVFRDFTQRENPRNQPAFIEPTEAVQRPFAFNQNETVQLHVRVEPAIRGFAIHAEVIRGEEESGSEATLRDVEPERLVGNVAMVSHPGSPQDRGHYRFRDFQVSGPKVDVDSNHEWGPILSTQYTLSENILKMTAQMPPVSEEDASVASLQVRPDEESSWRTVDESEIIAPGYTVPFRVEDWDGSREWQYRILYELAQPAGLYEFRGTIAEDPLEDEMLTVAGFTGNNNVHFAADGNHGNQAWDVRWTLDNIWFPHNQLVRHVKEHDPDVLAFTGDQVYEGRSPTGPVRNPQDEAMIDYLYKWYLWCWAFGDITRDRPTITIPDDHDVYHGNLWGWEGRATPGGQDMNKGGYLMSPEFVKMVERTQTSHFPDPYDPTPVHQGIGVYYTDMTYGGVSFAIIEDRKFKSPQTVLEGVELEDGHIMDVNFDSSQADVPGAQLLGERQLTFLRDWADDWKNAYLKMVISQTIFANLQTRDYYPDNLDRDLDSNGWPQSGRNRALDALRKGFAFHLAGDQHLGSTLHHGIDDWGDAIWSFCVPSIANFYLRFWEPPQPGGNYQPGMPPYTGQYQDGLQNKITVWAVANPTRPEELSDQERATRQLELHRKAVGYGIVHLNKEQQTITMANWPRKVDPDDGDPYRDWPITIHMRDNYAREAAAWLPTLDIQDITDPVIQIYKGDSEELVYALRIRDNRFDPKVFAQGEYRIRVGNPEADQWVEMQSVEALADKGAETLSVSLP